MCYYPEEADPDVQAQAQKQWQNDQASSASKQVQGQSQEVRSVQQDQVIQGSINQMKKSLKESEIMGAQAQHSGIKSTLEQELDNQNYQDELQLADSLDKLQMDDKMHGALQSNKFKQPKAEMDGLKPYPILKLKHALGFSGKHW